MWRNFLRLLTWFLTLLILVWVVGPLLTSTLGASYPSLEDQQLMKYFYVGVGGLWFFWLENLTTRRSVPANAKRAARALGFKSVPGIWLFALAHGWRIEPSSCSCGWGWLRPKPGGAYEGAGCVHTTQLELKAVPKAS
jgi:hypothetical protein